MNNLSEREAYIALAYANRIPSLKGLPIIKHIGSAAQFFTSSKELFASYSITNQAATALVDFRSNFNLTDELAQCDKENITVITYADTAYPEVLRELPDAPYALFVRGSLESLKKPTVAIVGTRKASPYALRVTEHFANDLAKSGATIISGLALGIDAAAHQATVRAAGTTIAVLGGGISDAALYPKNNLALAREIIATGGAVISEWAPTVAPTKYTFPLRNRIVAGLSRGVLVIEAPERSGALITAYLALEYNRDCFAVPADLFKANALGSNALLASGARIVLSPNDIAREYGVFTEQAAQKTTPNLEGSEGKIFDLIKQQTRSIDELHEATGLDISAISSMLSVMELDGLVKNIGGGKFSV